jgi:hypothetical protein
MDTIKKLESEGYINLPDENQQNQQQPNHTNRFPVKLSFLDTPDTAKPVCPIKLAAVKAILTEAADDYLGIMGRGIKTKIEACENKDSLKQVISNWHMAMRESKRGRESASFLMEQVHQTLEEKMVSA